MGVIVYFSVKKMGKTITLALACSGLFGVAAVAFSGFCLALLLSTVIGWITNAVNDLRIPPHSADDRCNMRHGTGSLLG